jgi:soluble lytic murein transglycosylase
MILAHGRLRSRNPGQADEVLRKAEALVEAERGSISLPSRLKAPAFQRAVELMRLSDIAGARVEVQSLGLGRGDGDALLVVAKLYAMVGDERLAHQVARQRTDDWSKSYPNGRWREAWELAYPQVYAGIVRQEAAASGIPLSLAYGIMREESAFDASVVSSADAYGLMQLIMPTATMVAKSLNMTVDAASLKRPEVNIKLGCKLLGSLRGSFSTMPVMAIPSYNAGAGATRRWLNERSGSDFDLWVERIPYEETRGYMKRVLSSVAVYSYLVDRDALGEVMQLPERVGSGS